VYNIYRPGAPSVGHSRVTFYCTVRTVRSSTRPEKCSESENRSRRKRKRTCKIQKKFYFRPGICEIDCLFSVSWGFSYARLMGIKALAIRSLLSASLPFIIRRAIDVECDIVVILRYPRVKRYKFLPTNSAKAPKRKNWPYLCGGL